MSIIMMMAVPMMLTMVMMVMVMGMMMLLLMMLDSQSRSQGATVMVARRNGGCAVTGDGDARSSWTYARPQKAWETKLLGGSRPGANGLGFCHLGDFWATGDSGRGRRGPPRAGRGGFGGVVIGGTRLPEYVNVRGAGKIVGGGALWYGPSERKPCRFRVRSVDRFVLLMIIIMMMAMPMMLTMVMMVVVMVMVSSTASRDRRERP